VDGVILDSHGQPLRRAIGFLLQMRREVPSRPILVDAQGYLVAIEEEYQASEICRRGDPALKLNDEK
jgi:hypothetical protein